MRLQTAFLAALSSAFLASAANAADLNLVTGNVRTVCSPLANPPFEFVEDGSPAGFDMEVADALAKSLGLEGKEVIDIPFEALKSGAALNARQCDVGINQVTPTPERRQNIGFSMDYLNDPEATGTLAGKGVKTFDDLAGKVLGVTSGSVEEVAFGKKLPEGATVKTYEDLLSLQKSVLTGQTDVIFYTYTGLAYKKDPNLEIGPDVLDIPNTYAVAVKKEGSEALLAAVDGALKTMIADGTIEKIAAKWFGSLPAEFAPQVAK